MKRDQRGWHLTRAALLQRLSSEVIATVSMAETSQPLVAGDEYLDLQQLARGVQRWLASGESLRRVLPRKAIHQRTWWSVMAALTVLENAAHGSRG